LKICQIEYKHGAGKFDNHLLADITYHLLEEKGDRDKEMRALSRLLAALLIVWVLDGLTKVWAVQTFEPYQPVPVIGQFFRLTLGYNTGVAFSLFTNSGLWPLLVTGVIILGLTVWFVSILRSGELPFQAAWPVGFILGGAMANFVDRLMDGKVIDFIDVGLGTTRWPAFNLADSCIVVGIVWLMFMRGKPAPDEETSEA
jgi:signal peptidase II